MARDQDRPERGPSEPRKEAFTIGELATAAGVPTSTLRFYERADLVCPTRRSASNYRLYDASTLGRVRFLRAAQASGFPLKDVRALLEIWDGEAAPCKEVEELIETRLTCVEERLKDLRHIRRTLKGALETCQAHPSRRRCEVVRQLSASAAGESVSRDSRRPRPPRAR